MPLTCPSARALPLARLSDSPARAVSRFLPGGIVGDDALGTAPAHTYGVTVAAAALWLLVIPLEVLLTAT